MTLKPKIGQFRGRSIAPSSRFITGSLLLIDDISAQIIPDNKTAKRLNHPGGIIPRWNINSPLATWKESLGQYTGQFAKIPPELAEAQPWRDVCPETGLTEIVGGYGLGVERGGDKVLHVSSGKVWNVYYNGQAEFTIYPKNFISSDICLEIIGTAWEGK